LHSLLAVQQIRARHEGKPWDPDAPFDWRFAVWFLNNRKRPAENRDAVYLREETPFEILTTIRLPGAWTVQTVTCAGLIAAALEALRTDVLNSKAPLLVLCDSLEEQGMPEADLLRAFAMRKQRWDRYCLNIGQGGGEQGGV
jgi:hypothetical protein